VQDFEEMTDTTTPAIGHNIKPLIDAGSLAADFGHITKQVDDAIALANGVPPVLEDEEDVGIARTAARALINAHKRAETTRVDVKQPYLDAERVVDSFFNQMKKRLFDMQTAIEKRGKQYLVKKEREEQARRDEEARLAREEEQRQREAARAAEAERQRIADAAAAAERLAQEARDEETRKAAAAEAARLANEATTQASQVLAATTKADAASSQAVTAQRAADAPPADKARTRVGDGMATLERTYNFEIIDLQKVDLEQLRAYISRPDIEKAIRAFVRTHKDTRELAGVRIYADRDAQFR
jgi:hypothetical protein